MSKTVYRPRVLSPTVRRLMEELSRLILEMEARNCGLVMAYNEKLDAEGIVFNCWLQKLEIARGLLAND